MPVKPTVRFYILPDGSGFEHRLELACKLAEKAQQERLQTLICCADEAMAAQLDHALWHYRADDSFLTHCRPDDPLAGASPAPTSSSTSAWKPRPTCRAIAAACWKS